MQFNPNFEKTQAQFTAINSKAVEFAEDNAKAVFAHARDVLTAKTPESFWSLQQNFFKAQQDVATRQFEAMNGLFATVVRETSAPLADAMKPFLGKAA